MTEMIRVSDLKKCIERGSLNFAYAQKYAAQAIELEKIREVVEKMKKKIPCSHGDQLIINGCSECNLHNATLLAILRELEGEK